MEKKYNHLQVEKNKNDFWIKGGFFNVDLNSNKKVFSLIMPPPNITGKLHLGHALDNSIQDLLIRFKKLDGYETLWIPGTDHAGIATQVVVEKKLKEQNIDKKKLSREEFLDYIWKWRNENTNNIKLQWNKFGLALDYNYEKFTFSKNSQKLVKKVFVKMYKNGYIYRAKTLVNWDTTLKTAISNIEVLYEQKKGKMFYIKYFLEDLDQYLNIATTRPETIFGDVCLVVNPNDNRYKKYINKKVINPLNGKKMPIISDSYVDIEFGTGIMKCTPGHDHNDYEIGKKYNLEIINILNIDGSLNNLCGKYSNLDRFEARKLIVEDLNKEGKLIKIEEITHQVSISERSKSIIEPLISMQWFVKMNDLAKDVLNLQQSDEAISLYPERFKNEINKWMNNIHDWTISRQLIWGHRIPAWYKNNEIYVGENAPNEDGWIQDNDVLDTWFSSSLWPLICTNWDIDKKINEQNKLFNKFFPISLMVTGYDIIFFWVSKMIMQSLLFVNKKPFTSILLHGLIRDEHGKKMSKSLGNGIDPFDVIEQFGADSLRMSLVTNSTPGLDIKFSEEKIKFSWNFINKLWNCARFIKICNEGKIYYLDNEKFIEKIFLINDQWNDINKWIINKLVKINIEIKQLFNKYEFVIAGKKLINFVWNDFCSWYLELAKLNIQDECSKITTIETLNFLLKNILIMLHPNIPFVTEDIYQNIYKKQSILNENWTIKYNVNIKKYNDIFVNNLIEIINKIREFKTNQNIANNKNLQFKTNANINVETISKYLIKLTNSTLIFNQNINDNNLLFIPFNENFIFIEKNSFINQNQVIKNLKKEYENLIKEIERSEKILNNKNFINKANPKKIKIEKDKYKKYLKQKNVIVEKINNLNN